MNGRRRFEDHWHDGQIWQGLSASVEGEPQALTSGSIEEFILEHYYGYASQRDGSTVEYEVEHPAWRIRNPLEASRTESVWRFYPPEFAEALKSNPHSVVVAEGSSIRVFQGRKL